MPADDEVKVSAVALKLPNFWIKNAAAWFAQTEAQFEIRGVTQDSTRYYYVVSALDAETATRADQVILKPPTGGKYTAIKEFLLSAFELSEAERAHQLLSIQDLGDRRPSELMSQILHLNGSDEHHFLLKYLFLNALPRAVRNALSTSQEKDLMKLSLEADLCHSIISSQNQSVYEADEIEAISKRKLCYWHRKFRKSAKKCEQPCDWKPFPPGQPSGNAQGGLH
jgi:hypothetical protein